MRLSLSQIRLWLLGLFLFLVPWQTRWIFNTPEIGGAPWEYGMLAIYATEILLWVAVLLWGKEIVLRFIKLGAWKWMVIAGTLIPFISVVWAAEPAVAFFGALHILEAVLLVAVIISVPRSAFRFVGGVFVAGAVVQALLAFYQIAAQWVHPSTLFGMALQDPIVPGVSVVETAGGRFLRAYGGLPHPNILGGYFVIALFVLVSLLREVRQRWLWLVALFGAALLAGSLFLTFSRSAWIALVVGVVGITALLVRRGKDELREPITRFRIVSLAVVVICVMGLFTFAFRDVVAARFSGIGRLETISQEERIGGVQDALKLMQARPIAGWGMSMFTAALASTMPGNPAWAYQPVHNVPLLMIAELGVFGALLLLAILAGLWWFLRTQWKPHVQDSLICFAGCAGALLAIAVIAILDHYLWSLYAGAMLWGAAFGFLLNQAKQIR